MADENRRRPPNPKAEQWRNELQHPGVTLEMIARREGISRQAVSLMVGPLNRHMAIGQSRQELQELIRPHLEAGLDDARIADATGLKVSHVVSLRLGLGIRRPAPNKRHTPETSIHYVCLWHKDY